MDFRLERVAPSLDAGALTTPPITRRRVREVDECRAEGAVERSPRAAAMSSFGTLLLAISLASEALAVASHALLLSLVTAFASSTLAVASHALLLPLVTAFASSTSFTS